MSNAKPPRKRRSFRVIFKIIKFFIAMVLTFFISFGVTFFMKSEHPADYFGIFGEEIFSSEEPPKISGNPKIKTLFDEQNNTPFDPRKFSDEKKTPNVAASDNERVLSERQPAEDTPRSKDSDDGIFDSLGRMTSIEPAVNAKIKNIPNYVSLNKMPNFLGQAIISVEDTRFYKHKGFDLIGIARAIFTNVEAGEIREGASTITQQTVKNLFLTSDKTFTRKAEELILSMNMEDNFSKDKILELYLNVIYFGSDFYGIYDAAQGYFGKEPADLTLAECAMLAGLPNAPSLYSPYVDFHAAKKRQLVVIDAMEKLGIISVREAESARIEEIILAR